MSTPDSVWTADGVEISVDRNGPLLQFSVADRREGCAAWRLVTDLTADEVAELHGYLGNWLKNRKVTAL
jgi:hypothetical protein